MTGNTNWNNADGETEEKDKKGVEEGRDEWIEGCTEQITGKRKMAGKVEAVDCNFPHMVLGGIKGQRSLRHRVAILPLICMGPVIDQMAFLDKRLQQCSGSVRLYLGRVGL